MQAVDIFNISRISSFITVVHINFAHVLMKLLQHVPVYVLILQILKLNDLNNIVRLLFKVAIVLFRSNFSIIKLKTNLSSSISC